MRSPQLYFIVLFSYFNNQLIISLIQISRSKMEEGFQSNLLSYSQEEPEILENNSLSLDAYKFVDKSVNYSQSYLSQNQNFMRLNEQSPSMSQANYQSLDYGQKIAVSHNILKGLVHMLDRKFPTNSPTNKQITQNTAEMSFRIAEAKEVLQKRSQPQQKMEEKMVEVRDRLAQIITFINQQIDAKPSKVQEKHPYLPQIRNLAYKNVITQQRESQNEKELIEIKRQQKAKQQKTQIQPKIVIDRNKLNNAKEVFSQEVLNNFAHPQPSAQKKDHMKCSLDKISQANSGETVGIKSNKTSENVSQIRSQPPKIEMFNFQEENVGELDETGRIILSTINKKTVSTTTIPKNNHKHQKSAENVNYNELREKKEQNMGYKVRKSKFWKDKTTVFQNSQINQKSHFEQKLNQVERNQLQQNREQEAQKSAKNINKSSNFHNQDHQRSPSNKHIHQNLPNSQKNYPFFPNYPRKVFQRNNSLKQFKRAEIKKSFQNLPIYKSKLNLPENQFLSPQMKESKIVQQFAHFNHRITKSSQDQARVPLPKPSNVNPQMLPHNLLQRHAIIQPQNLINQNRQEIRIVPLISSRPQSLPNHFNNSLNQSSQLIRTSLPPNVHLNIANISPKTIITSPRVINTPNVPRHYVYSSNDSRIILPKSPSSKERSPMNRSVHIIPQQMANLPSNSTLNPHQGFNNQVYPEIRLQRFADSSKTKPSASLSKKQLQKIIELSQQSIQNSIRKDNRSEYSIQTTSHKLHISTANQSISSNNRPLKKRGIQLTSKEFIHIQQVQ